MDENGFKQKGLKMKNIKKKSKMDERVEAMAQKYETTALDFYNHPEKLKEYLRNVLRLKCGMKDYSAYNKLLILAQNPDASYVQSYNAWKEMGIPVTKKGALYIYAPIFMKQVKSPNFDKPKSWNSCTKEEKKWASDASRTDYVIENRKISDKVVHVFDISSTDATEEDLLKLMPKNHMANIKDVYEVLSESFELESSKDTMEEKIWDIIYDYVDSELKNQYEEFENFSILSEAVSYCVYDFIGLDTTLVQFKSLQDKIWKEDEIKDLTMLNKAICENGKKYSEIVYSYLL